MPVNNRLRAVVFDADGVLFESVDVKTEAFRLLFSSEKPDDLEKIIQYHVQNGGVSRFEKFKFIYNEILQKPLTQERFDNLCQEFAKHVVERVVASPWVPGALEFLQKHHKTYLCFIASATPDPEIKAIAVKRHIETYFQDVLGSPQPKAVLLKTIIDRYDLHPENMVYVGDAQNDWQAAKAHGIPFIWRRLTNGSDIPGYQGTSLFSLEKLEEALFQASQVNV